MLASIIRRIALSTLLGALMAGALVGRVVAAPASQAATVEMQDFIFAPGTITIQVGTAIDFPNTGKEPHTATADDGSWDSGNVNGGDSFSFTFNSAGTFPYFCKYHGTAGGVGMAGTIIVEAAAAAPAATTAPAPTATTAPAATATTAPAPAATAAPTAAVPTATTAPAAPAGGAPADPAPEGQAPAAPEDGAGGSILPVALVALGAAILAGFGVALARRRSAR